MRTERGFTIIELLLYSAISAAMIASISIILSTLLDIRIKNQSIAEVEQQGQILMSSLTKAIRNADTVNDLPQGATEAVLSITANGVNTVYSSENGRMMVSINGGGAIPLTNSKVEITNLRFSNYARPGTNGLFRIEFTISRLNPVGGARNAFERTFIGSAGQY